MRGSCDRCNVEPEDVGPRAQHLRQAFRKALMSTVKRSTYVPGLSSHCGRRRR
jgi:hypothetical protein